MSRRVVPLYLRNSALIASRRRTFPNGHVKGTVGRYVNIGGQEGESGWRMLMLRREGIEGVAWVAVTITRVGRARYAVLPSARYQRQIWPIGGPI